MPHSETPGSPIARISPGLFAACHVLHRLSVPRHPPNALTRLIRSSSAAHREQTPCLRQLRLDLYSALHFYPPGHRPRSLAPRARSSKSISPRPGNPCQRPVAFLSTMSMSSSTNDDRPEGSRPRHRSRRTRLFSLGTWPSSSDAGSGGADALTPSALVEPTGIEPVTPCLQSRCSPS